MAKLLPVYYPRERGGERQKEKKGRKERADGGREERKEHRTGNLETCSQLSQKISCDFRQVLSPFWVSDSSLVQ